MGLSELNKCTRFLLVESNLKTQFPYIKVPVFAREDRMIILAPTKTLKDIKEELVNSGRINDVNFSGIDGSNISLNTLAIHAVKDPIVIKVNETYNYGVFNLSTHRNFLTPSQRSTAESIKHSNYLSSHEAETLGCFNDFMINELEKSQENSVSYNHFLSLSKLSVLMFMNQQRIQKDHLQKQLNLVKTMYDYELNVKYSIENEANERSNKGLKRFSYVLITQFAAIQYGTYWLYSWDIMEPITCLMTMGDVCIGYMFWMLTGGKEYGMDGIKRFFFERRLRKLYRKRKVNREEVEKICKIVEDLETRLKIT